MKGPRDPGNYKPHSLPSVTGKILEHILKQSDCKCVKYMKVVNNTQCGFFKASYI